MRQCFFLFSAVLLVSLECSYASQGNAITIVNAAGVDAALVERVRSFAEEQLHVPVRTLEEPSLCGSDRFQTLEKTALSIKTDADVSFIVIAVVNGDDKHLEVYPVDGVAIINTRPLSSDDSEVFVRRLERLVMRAAAFVFEMPPTPDPFCVTRDYQALADLDRMGRNYSPPWMGRFADEAKKRGLQPLQAGGLKLPKMEN